MPRVSSFAIHIHNKFTDTFFLRHQFNLPKSLQETILNDTLQSSYKINTPNLSVYVKMEKCHKKMCPKRFLLKSNMAEHVTLCFYRIGISRLMCGKIPFLLTLMKQLVKQVADNEYMINPALIFYPGYLYCKQINISNHTLKEHC